MRALGEFIVRRRVWVVVGAAVATVAAGLFGFGVVSSLSNSGFEDADAESVIAAKVLADEFGVDDPAMVIVVETSEGTVDDAEVAAAGMALVGELGEEAGVSSVASYWTLGSPPSLRSRNANHALVFVSIEGDQGAVLDRSAELAEEYRGERERFSVHVGGAGPLFAEIQETVERDLIRAEVIAFPITALLLVVIFGGLVAASLPLLIGGFAIVSTLFILQVLTGFTEVSIFALNLTTALGLGLAIDYALFVVSRYREELGNGVEPHQAAVRTVLTAGRTVIFSAITVAISLAAMLVFRLPFLKSFGFAGIAVVLMSGIGAVVVLPAILAMLGHNVDKLRIRKVRHKDVGTGFWYRVAMAVMKRPWSVGTAAVVVLVALGLPFIHVTLGTSDDRMLPATSYARQVGDILRGEFDEFESAALTVVARGVDADASRDEISAFAASLSTIDHVARVDGATGSYVDGTLAVPPSFASMQFVSSAGTYFSVVPDVDTNGDVGEDIVHALRDAEAPFDTMVTGGASFLVDNKDSLLDSLPMAVGMIVLATFVLLFLMFGSVVVPAKAIVLNLLSLSATFGAIVWVFQDGHLSEFLGFTATGSIEIVLPILIFSVAFGLSMDYEVFLLSRIKEEYDKTHDNVHSVAVGLERTGRIVTAAALLISVVFVAFATSGVVLMKAVGVGMTIAVLVDAFVVRATLVPAFMRLAGDINWWAPRWLRPVYRRFGISEHVELEPTTGD